MEIYYNGFDINHINELFSIDHLTDEQVDDILEMFNGKDLDD